MPYICYCKDHPGSESLRKKHTRAHLHYIETILDRILVAGPLLEPGSGAYSGSCLIYQVETKEEALALLHNDPYYSAGVFAEVRCEPFKPVAGSYVGGKTW